MANATVARPIIRSDLGQIWFADISKGFHVVQFREGVWPFAGTDPCPHSDYYLEQYDLGYHDCRAERSKPVQLPSTNPCRTSRNLSIRLRGRFKSIRAYVNGKSVPVTRRGSRVYLRGLPTGRYTVRIVAITAGGRRIVVRRTYRTCVPSGRSLRETVRPGAAAPHLRAISYLCRAVGPHVVSAA